MEMNDRLKIIIGWTLQYCGITYFTNGKLYPTRFVIDQTLRNNRPLQSH
jgi:hypothetical protein